VTDVEAQKAMVKVVVDWLDGKQPTAEFIGTYWGTRDDLLSTNYSAFDGPVGEILSHMDVAMHSYWAEPETEGEIGEAELEPTMLSLLAQLRDMSFPIPDLGPSP